jgi:anti-sigma B factor antagonist
MRADSPRLKISTEGDVSIVELTDRKILDEINIGQIGDELGTLISQSPKPKLVLDFTAVCHMSSSALGMLITVHKRIREKGGQLRMCNIGPAIHEVFVIMRLNDVFQICPTRDDALASLNQPQG